MYYANYTAEMLRAINLDGVAFACANICLPVRICMIVNISIYFVYNIYRWSEDIRVYITLFSFCVCWFMSLSVSTVYILFIIYMCKRACLRSHASRHSIVH